MGKWPMKKKDTVRSSKNGSQQKPYFGAALRAFLRDAALSDELLLSSSPNEQSSSTQSSKLKMSQGAATRLLCTGDPTTSTSGHSLEMPHQLQTQNLKEICACLNTSTDGRPLTSWQSAIPFSMNPVMVYKSSTKTKDQSPVRRMIQEFAIAFQSRVLDKKTRFQLRTNDADYGYFLLSLCKYKRILEHYSRAYHQSDVTTLPIEIKSVVMEMLELLPILPAGKDALASTTVRGSVAVPTTFACCLPRLAGSNRVQAFRDLQLPLSARQALENFGGRDQLEGIYKQVMLRFRQDYPAFENHDVLHAIGLFTCVLTFYEHYNLGVHNHVIAQRQNDKETKQQHMSLMRGLSAHAPLSESFSSLSRPITAPATTSRQLSTAKALGDKNHNHISRPSNVSLDELHQESAITGHLWIAPVLPPFSAQTFAGPFGRSEQQVLNRLLELDSSGRLERGYSTLGRSFYRDAVTDPGKARTEDQQKLYSARRPLLVHRKSSSEDLFQSCLPSFDHVNGSSSPIHIINPKEGSSDVLLDSRSAQDCTQSGTAVQAAPASIFDPQLYDIQSSTLAKTELHNFNVVSSTSYP